MESKKLNAARGAREAIQALPYIAELSPLVMGAILVSNVDAWHVGFVVVAGIAHVVAPFLLYSDWGKLQFEERARSHAATAAVVLMFVILGGTLFSELSRFAPIGVLAVTLVTTLVPHPLVTQNLSLAFWGAGGLVLRTALLMPLGVLLTGQSPGPDIWLVGFFVGTLLLAWILIHRREWLYANGWERQEVASGTNGEVPRPGKFTKAFGFLLTVGATLLSVAVALGRAPFEMSVSVLVLLAGTKILNLYYDQQWNDELTEDRVCQLLIGTLAVLFVVIAYLR